ncbi:unnamed protein product, partial [Heligmosomoides polygyrus]|uniref:Endo/exonuclease/phosphatase domain-containing protein n=1 Tax=Heligmosomoides polygyrus TaxID=6339 RepID=A0A183FKZ4_HELPZ
MKRRRIQVQCLQETPWKGAKAREIGEGVKLYYNGEDTKRNGVGIAVAESLKDSVAAVQRINDSIMSLWLDTKEGYWIIMSVYAPQTGCSEHDKDDFYLSLEEAIRSVPEGDYLSIAGDMNGHVGSGRRGAERVHGVVKTVKSADGRVLRKPVEVRERWEEYFTELLNEEFPRREAEDEQQTEGPIPSWTQEELRKAIEKMKLGKASGPDGVPVEAWKVLGDLGINGLTQFLNRITKE